MSQSADRPFTAEQSVPGSSMELEAIIERLIGRVYTTTLVKVESVGEEGYSYNDVAAVGYLDAISLIQQVNGKNEGIENKPMYRLPYFRLQGGTNAVICDPKPGDIGIAVIAMRDISSIKETKQQEAPPSRRQYDPSDGLYIGGFLNDVPEQFIHFLESGINIVSTGDVGLTTPKNVNIECVDFNVNCTSFNVVAESEMTVESESVEIACQELNVDSPQSTFTGNVSAANIAASGSVSDGAGTVGDIRDAYNAHNHPVTAVGSPTGGTSDPV